MLNDSLKSPRYRSKTEMLESKRKQLLKELNESCNFNHKTQLDRLLLREKIIYASPARPITPLHDRIKLENMQHYSKTFADRPLGIHGKELPKFYENFKEYWKKDSNSYRKASNRKPGAALESEKGSDSERSDDFFSRTTRENKFKIVKKPTDLEISECYPTKEHFRDSRWTNYHYKFLQKSMFEVEKVITKSTTPDVSSNQKASKAPKVLMIHRMIKRGGHSPGKDPLISTGFSK